MLIETHRAGAPFPHCGAAHGASGGPRAGPELGLQKQRISVVLHTAIAEQIVNELASGEGGRVHGAKCLAVLAGVA